jgi:hypothetical protein
MHVARRSTAVFFGKSATALLLMASFLWRAAHAEPGDTPAAKPPNRIFVHAEGNSGHVADPPELARLRYAGKSFRDWQEIFLTDLEPASRLKALRALQKFGRYGYGREAAKTIAAALADDDEELVEQAINAAVSIGRDAVPALTDVCMNSRGAMRKSALEAIRRLGPEAADAAPAMFDLLAALHDKRDGDLRASSKVYDALVAIGPAQTPLLVKQLAAPNQTNRDLAAAILGALGTDAREAAPALLIAFKDKKAATRAQVGAALWQVAPENDEVRKALSEAIQQDEQIVRMAIISAIRQRFCAHQEGEYGGFARSPDDEDASHSHGVAEADLAPGELANGLSLLIEAMRSPAFELGLSAPTMVETGPAMVDAYYARVVAADVVLALKGAGRRAEPVVQELAELAQSKKTRSATAAVEVLGTMGRGAAAALPTLRAILEQKGKQGAPGDDRFLEAVRQAERQISSQIEFHDAAAPPIVELPDAPSVR